MSFLSIFDGEGGAGMRKDTNHGARHLICGMPCGYGCWISLEISTNRSTILVEIIVCCIFIKSDANHCPFYLFVNSFTISSNLISIFLKPTSSSWKWFFRGLWFSNDLDMPMAVRYAFGAKFGRFSCKNREVNTNNNPHVSPIKRTISTKEVSFL